MICSGCRFEGGIGYKNHERDCDKYVMCSPSGVKGNLKADVRTCGVGEYWDQTLLTCRLSKDVPCSTGNSFKSLQNSQPDIYPGVIEYKRNCTNTAHHY